MILGIRRVVDVRDLEPGRFYLRLDYGNDPVLFQCIRMGENPDGTPDLKALWFNPTDERPIGLEDIPHSGPVVSLPDVKVRVDPPTLIASKYTSHVRPGMFLVAGDEPFLVVPYNRGWITVNMATGRPVESNWNGEWVAFSRWLLMIDDNGQEIEIAAFGKDDPE